MKLIESFVAVVLWALLWCFAGNAHKTEAQWDPEMSGRNLEWEAETQEGAMESAAQAETEELPTEPAAQPEGIEGEFAAQPEGTEGEPAAQPEETERESYRQPEETEDEFDTQPEETENESETGRERVVYLSNLRLISAEGEKVYDGTDFVALAAEAVGLPEGMSVSLTGHSESANVGTWPVTVQAELEGEGSEEYQIRFAEQETESETERDAEMETTWETHEDSGSEDPPILFVTICPRPLRLEISDASKPYYSENSLKNLVFYEDEPIKAKGFVEDEQGRELIPEGFELPELIIDETVLQKGSPMYQNGEEVFYKNAVILKTDENGNLTGSPTENYCFSMENEEYFRGGTVVLSAPPVVGTLDYRICCSVDGASWLDGYGQFWIRAGVGIEIQPDSGRGFTTGRRMEGLYESGTEEFALENRSPEGELLAESQIRSVSWKVDGTAPEGELFISGENAGASREEESGETEYYAGPVRGKIQEISDLESGVKSVRLFAASGELLSLPPEQIYSRTSPNWQEGTELFLSEEGSFRILARLEDHVGNVRYKASKIILIDRTGPLIHISGVLPGSANGGPVEPVITCEESHLPEDGLSFALEGAETGERKVSWESHDLPNGAEVQISDIPHKKGWDDLYVLRVKASDLAGNQTEEEIRFSVNRFGSVYQISEETKKQLAHYYLREPTTVVISEINVDDLEESRITVGYDGQMRILRKNVDYLVEKRGTGNTWKEYRYTIPAAQFQKEGFYYIICSSRDRALNEGDNRMQKKKLEFAVDRTAPSILITGIEDGKIYGEDSRRVCVECRDNLAFQEVRIRLNEKEILRSSEEEQYLELNSGSRWQILQATAWDKAGNKWSGEPCYFWVGDKTRVKRLVRKEEAPERVNSKELYRESGSVGEGDEKAWKTDEASDEIQEKEEFERNHPAGKREKMAPDICIKLAGIAVFTILTAILCRLKQVK